MLLFLRRPDAVLRPQFWAEDGRVFFMDAYNSGASVFEPYNGYIHLLPRLIARLSLSLPPVWTPTAYNSSAALLTLAVVAFVASERIALPLRLRQLMALTVVAVPLPPEVLLSLTNVQWVLVPFLFAMSIAEDAPRRSRTLVDATAVVAVGLTSPLVIVLFPCLFLRAMVRRTAASCIVAAAAVGAAVVQYASLLAHPRWTSATPVRGVQALELVGAKIAFLFAGDLARSWPVPDVMLLLLLVGVTVAAATVRREHRLLLLLLGMACTTVAALRFGPGYAALTIAERYLYPTVVAGAWCVTWLLWGRLYLGWLALALGCAVLATHLTAAPLVDLHWWSAAQCIGSKRRCWIPINPVPWKIVLVTPDAPE